MPSRVLFLFPLGRWLRSLGLVLVALAAVYSLRAAPTNTVTGLTTNLDSLDVLLIKLGITNPPAGLTSLNALLKLGITNPPAYDEYTKMSDPRMVDPVLTNLLPVEYDAFRTTVHETSLVHAAQAVLVLEARSEELLTDAAAGGPARSNRLAACCAAWKLCLRVERLSTNAVNAEAKRMILDKWNRSLKQGTASAAMQVAALVTIWDPTLATEDLWRLFEAAHDKTTISAFASLIYNRGSAEDWERLRNRLGREGDATCAGILRHALDYKAFRDRGRTGQRPSGGAPLPLME